jgi:multisubunit Na+/H+ antiporter MnhB subunit
MFQTPEFRDDNYANELPVATRILCAITIVALGFGLIFAIIVTENISSLLPGLVQQKLTQSGVQNPVTAVLLNFRSYDTLLEIGVLLTVAVAMLPNANFNSEISPDMPDGNRSSRRLVSVVNSAAVNPPLEAFLRWLIPMIVVMAGYMLWTGTALPGGAFQSGALLAGAGVLAQLSGRIQFCFTSTTAKLLLTIGLITFVMVAVGVATTTGVVLQYPLELAAPLILLVESAATLSIAAILLLSYNTLATQTFESSSEHSTFKHSAFDKQPSDLTETSAPDETLQSQTAEDPKP